MLNRERIQHLLYLKIYRQLHRDLEFSITSSEQIMFKTIFQRQLRLKYQTVMIIFFYLPRGKRIPKALPLRCKIDYSFHAVKRLMLLPVPLPPVFSSPGLQRFIRLMIRNVHLLLILHKKLNN